MSRSDLSLAQAKRRLHSRSSGLLEVTSHERTVQFIHQTAKDFMSTKTGHSIICDGIDSTFQETGHVLLLKHFVRNSLNNHQVRDSQELRIQMFSLEKGGRPSIPYLEAFILKLAELERFNTTLAIIDHSQPCPPSLLVEYVKSTGDLEFAFCMIAFLICLKLSVQVKLETHSEIIRAHGGMFLLSALYTPSYAGYGTADIRILETLLRGGVHSDSRVHDHGVTAVSWLIVNYNLTGDSFAFVKTLFEYGADPNQILSSLSPDWPRNPGRLLDAEAFSSIVNSLTLTDDSFGYRPLLYAILYDNKALVRLLIEYGADPCCLNNMGLNVFHPLKEHFEDTDQPLKQFRYEYFISQCEKMKDILFQNYQAV